MMWSKQPWLDTDTADRSTLPSGRFIAGTTSTNLGDIRIYGVCIPWHSAHVRNGREDRRPWQDHEIYLRGLPSLIAETQFPIVVAGDYNQRIPAKSQPKTMFELLTTAISGLVVSSAIDLDKPLLDHIAHSSSLQSGLAVVIPDTFNGVRLTDHRGVHVELVLKPI